MKLFAHKFTKGWGTLQAKSRIAYSALFASLLLMLALAPGALAQGITGSITGTVTDATGAIVAGATVTVRNVDTNAIRTVTTSDAGSYTVPQLHPGNYSVRVDKAGFKLYEQSSVTVQMDQVVVIGAQLQVGSERETITVTTAPPVIQTEQSSNGLLLDSNQIDSTPLNGRLTLQGLMILSPGVQGMPNAQDQIPTSGVTLSVGSTRRNSYGTLATTLDGSVIEEVVLQRSAGEVPSIDALDQFKIINDSCGHSAGDTLLGQVGALLKSKVRWRDTLSRAAGAVIIVFGLTMLGVVRIPVDRAIEVLAQRGLPSRGEVARK